MFNIKNIEKSYGKNLVLKDLDLEIKSGTVVAIIGKNGTGKSTLLKIILNLIKSYKGKVDLGDQNIAGVIEDASFYPNLSGLENLKLLLSKDEINTSKELIEYFQMQEYIDQKTKKYSMGMKQRLSLVYCLCRDVGIYLLDEPTNSLDVEAVYKFEQIIKKYKNNEKTIVIVSHNIGRVHTFCDVIYELKDRKLTRVDNFEATNYKIEFEFMTTELTKEASSSIPDDHQIDGEKIYLHLTKKEIPKYIQKLSEFQLISVTRVNEFLNDNGSGIDV